MPPTTVIRYEYGGTGMTMPFGGMPYRYSEYGIWYWDTGSIATGILAFGLAH